MLNYLEEKIEKLGLNPPDWNEHPLGKPAHWPVELSIIVNTLLSSVAPSWVSWGKGRHVFYNTGYQELLGSRAKDSFGRDFSELWPEIWDQLGAMFDIVSRGDSVSFKDHQFELLRNGIKETAYFDFSFSPVLSLSGENIAVQCVCSETTKRMNREYEQKIALEKKEAVHIAVEFERKRFLNFFNDAPLSTAMLDGPDHIFSYANEKYSELVAGRELIGKSVREAFPELADQGFYELLDTVYRTGQAFRAGEIEAILKDEEGQSYPIVIELIYAARRDALGRVEGISVFALDVSEKVESRKNIEAQRRLTRLVVDNIPANISYLDQSLNIQLVNKFITSSFDKDQEYFLGHSISKIFTPEQFKAREDIYKSALSGKVQDAMLTLTNSKGEIRTTRNIVTPDVDRNGIINGIVIIGYDITEEEKLKTDLVYARQSAEAANNAKSAFLANMSHEIRSPLGAIMGFASLIKENTSVSGEATAYFQIIERNSQQVLRIIDDILDLSKVEAGKMMIEEVEFSLLEVLSDFTSLMKFRAREKGIEFSVVAETSLPNPTVSDPTRLRQILMNIIGNALKFTHKGKITLYVSFDSGKLKFRVQDTGIGISKIDAEQLFEAFHQADSTTTRRFGGTGLGLVLTRKLARAMGGDFWLDHSEPGEGSVFIATVKVKPCERTEFVKVEEFVLGQAVPKLAVPIPNLVLKGAHILIVEDSPDNQMLLNVILKHAGSTTESAYDGSEGVLKALEKDFDLILMDVQMPKMDGYEAVNSLRVQGYNKPIIAITAHAMKDERQRCLAAGYTDYLSKPIDKLKVVEAIRLHLNR